MGVVDGVADLQKDAESRVELRLDGLAGNGPRAEIVVKPLPAHQLHGEEVLTIIGPARLVDRRDPRVAKLSERELFAPKEPDVLLGYVGTGSNYLERDRAGRGSLLRLIDDSHSPSAQDTLDLESADLLRQVPYGIRVGGRDLRSLEQFAYASGLENFGESTIRVEEGLGLGQKLGIIRARLGHEVRAFGFRQLGGLKQNPLQARELLRVHDSPPTDTRERAT